MASLDLDNDVALSDNETLRTPQEVLGTLENAWLNEKFSPEILPHKYDDVESMYDQLSVMEGNLEKLRAGDFLVEVHRMEIDRIRYVLSSYLRTRLEKIEEFTAHILEQESQREDDDHYLSPGERKFAEEYLGHMETHFHTLALRHMPHNLQDFDKRKMKVTPNIHSHVFLCAKRDVTGIMLEGGEEGDEEIDLQEGSQHIMLYSSVSGFVKGGHVQLI